MPKISKFQNFSSLLRKKKGLLQCIFSTLLFQVSVTTLVVYFLHKNNPNILQVKKNSILFLVFSLIVGIVLIYCMAFVKMEFYKRFILFVIFSIIQGVLLYIATEKIPEEVILSALFSTISIFVLCISFGFILVYFGFDIQWIGILLFFVLLGLIITRIVYIFIPPSENKKRILTTISILLFSIYILYDTNTILLRYEDTKVNCIRGALDYYLDIGNLFINLLDNN